MMIFRGPGKAPALLSGGDCSAVSQFIPGKDLQEVLLLLLILTRSKQSSSKVISDLLFPGIFQQPINKSHIFSVHSDLHDK